MWHDLVGHRWHRRGRPQTHVGGHEQPERVDQCDTLSHDESDVVGRALVDPVNDSHADTDASDRAVASTADRADACADSAPGARDTAGSARHLAAG